MKWNYGSSQVVEIKRHGYVDHDPTRTLIPVSVLRCFDVIGDR
ncbi:hypothetical protein HanRHA438_Chr15g0722381 [Helianthus annuus]|nr:hypothetical protein HanRHA438_Chr15g0722381 [Helianthus annuus]